MVKKNLSLQKNNCTMKKFMLFIALLCAGRMISAQEVMKLENVAAPTEKDGWIGNTNLAYMSVMADAIMVMAPRQIDPDINGKITSLKFYRQVYNEYNTASFTLKIYEGIDLQVYSEYMNYYYFESCGEEVYSQDYTATEEGWQTIELDVPYEIPDGEFWIGVEMHGDGMAVYGGQSDAVRGQYYYSDMFEFVWYWKPSYFVVDWDEVLFSLGMAVYVEGGVSCNPVQNLQGFSVADAPFVSLDWDTPEAGSTGNLLGYNVYRDDVKINEELITICTFGDTQTEEETTYAYSVEAVYDDGCASQCDPIEVTTGGWGVSENESMNINVYPNPAEGFVNVKAEGLKNVELIDMMGRVISRNESSETMTTIDLSSLTSGIYFLRVTTESGVSLQRIAVK